MGLMAKLFGQGEPDHPELDAGSEAAKQLERFREPLHQLAEEFGGERMELVPSENGGYVFVGKPPKQFALAWLVNGEVKHFKSLVEEGNLSPVLMEKLVGKLTEAYEVSKDAPRYKAQVGDYAMVVVPDATLESNVRQLIDEMNEKVRKKKEKAAAAASGGEAGG